MVQSLQLGTSHHDSDRKGMQRVNRLPIIVGIVIALVFFGVVIAGLSWRGLTLGSREADNATSDRPATSFGERLKQGVSDGIIGEPDQRQVFQPSPKIEEQKPPEAQPGNREARMEAPQRPSLAPLDGEWKIRLAREQEEQFMREAQRQRMARLQARATALDSPVTVDIADLRNGWDSASTDDRRAVSEASPAISGMTASEIRQSLIGQNGDANGQAAKEDFFNRDIKDLGYLPNQVLPPLSAYELKRGSVIPATMITGLNSDLPGRITAQVSQNVYDSATGGRLLIPQGAKLFGRYDSKVSFGQNRVLAVWTDLIFPNGSTLQIGAMAGTDAAGFGGFKDKTDRHLWRTFGSAALVAVIGTGIDMSMPESSTRAMQDTASDAARRNFAETFGRVAEQTISKNLNVQPTITIRPGYKFNVLVDQDIVFPGAYRSR